MDSVSTPQFNGVDSGSNVAVPDEHLKRAGGEHPVGMHVPRPFGLFDLIRQWQPMGYRVVVNLPYIGNDQTYMFLIRPHPFIPWLPEATSGNYNWYRMYNYFRPVIHDNINTNFTVNDYANPHDIQPGISITQHSPPPLLGRLAQYYRKWRGDMKYRFRCVTNFAAQGYVMTTFNRSALEFYKDYDFNKQVMPPLRMDHSYNQGMYNSYVSSDCSMFRHMNISVPFEYLYDWMDFHQQMENLALSGIPGTDRNVKCDAMRRNIVGVGLRGAVAASDNANQMYYELEYCAGENFEFAVPRPPVMDLFSGVEYHRNGDTWRRQIAVEGYTIPNTKYSTNGVSTFNMIGLRNAVDVDTKVMNLQRKFLSRSKESLL